MPIWQWINDNLPPYGEEIIINEEVEQIQETLNQFKQLVPEGFQKLEPAKKNNWGSTEGLDKLLCERYLFVRENNKPIWLDIPHELMEKLEMPMGKTCPWPFYVKSKVLEPEREEVEGAITIENKEEIFLEKPFTVENLEEDIKIYYNKINELKKWTDQFPGQTPEQVQEQLNSIQQELEKEKGWWDKWINDTATYCGSGTGKEIKKTDNSEFWYRQQEAESDNAILSLTMGKNRKTVEELTKDNFYSFKFYATILVSSWKTPDYQIKLWEVKEMFKEIYYYYRNR